MRTSCNYISMRKILSSLFVLAFSFLFATPVFAYYTNMPAALVVGQPDFTSTAANQGGSAGANTMNRPTGVFVKNGKMFVVDRINSRVLIYNSIPTTNNASADIVIGQSSFSGTSTNQGGSRGPNTLANPIYVFSDGTRMYVSDYSNNRVLIWNTIPTANNTSADVVVGQTSFSGGTANSGGRGANTLSGMEAIWSDGSKLFISDVGNNRILIFNSIPTSNNASADVVIGQQNFTSGSANQGGSAAANTLNGPNGLWVDNGKLFVVDTSNNRLLIYNAIPTTNNVSADVVVGQTNFTSTSANQGNSSPGANTFKSLRGVVVAGGRVFTSEYSDSSGNNRILIFNSIPTTNNASADIVLGQSSFSGSSGATTTANTFTNVRYLFADGNKLYVPDETSGSSNPASRLLIFSNTLPDTTLTNTLVSDISNGRERLKGRATTNVVNGIVKALEWSINGTDSWTGAFPSDGQFDSPTEDFFFDFDPKTNNPDTINNTGFTIRVRNTHSNTIDVSASALYFEPFALNSPGDKTYTASSLPTFSFSINTWRFADLSSDLDRFRVSINKDNTGWVPYIDTIPVDYEKVRNSGDNLQKSVVASSGNGTYEDKIKTIHYSNNNGTIEVTPKGVDVSGTTSDKYREDGGSKLSKGSYQWKVEAVVSSTQFSKRHVRGLLT